MTNRFKDATTLDQLINQLVGACSTTQFWDEEAMPRPGVFMEGNATELAKEAIERANELTARITWTEAGYATIEFKVPGDSEEAGDK